MSPRWRWLTPPGPAALGLLELEALPPGLCEPPAPPPGRLRLVRLRRPDGATVDQAVVLAGEGSWQLAVHGGAGVRQAVAACLAAHGLAEAPGQALGGPPASGRWRALSRAAAPAAVAWLLAHAAAEEPPFPARFLDRQPLVLITGPANAGKSTLLNAWSGRARALVSAQPGTTRDLVSANVLAAGWRLTVVDSAGLRPGGDALERAGQALARAARERADLVLYLAHPGEPCTPGQEDLLVLGRSDERPGLDGALGWSALASDGERERLLALLAARVLARLGLPG